MAVFRIDKTRDYTVMANHHLRNKALSLKAKGLLSLMRSLPEDWDYTTKGLSMICKDGVDSIGRESLRCLCPVSRHIRENQSSRKAYDGDRRHADAHHQLRQDPGHLCRLS